ncbi:hypothetical protein TPHA_0H01720 [Tetrapisispora phaffii CBS 4417]|uniref:Protein BCP1 n=1 Tax=Tetrapisispora phaffii (strain ATCC 24235 / CBS 4417 / NBRC 1672 / NRRL Y-8282 / UCD 70-5) TaxID=1071381 RepID=G8BX74_TETPH|nr:hypothetical protein TPHA_0H01720 [Tetrapisispora phaffii CBS 4417]CCE64378.1 hypothetical protein TPHA_0H01720 [Tetrapisispora phaffii CBS 4417]
MVQAIKLSELTNRKRPAGDGANADSESDIDISSTDSENENENEEAGDEEIVNIDFDFFNGNIDVDFHAMKNLMRQLLGPQESNKVQLSALADLILNSPTTTIKTDGPESDPYCFLSFIDYKENRDSDWSKYLQNLDIRLKTFLKTIDSSNKKCALVASERLINMPPEVITPLYRITLEDVQNSLGDGQHYDFYVILSRKYEVNVDADETTSDRNKKRVKSDEIEYYHEEDRFFEKYSQIHFDSESRKGIISTYIVINHENLLKAINEFETEVAKW